MDIQHLKSCLRYNAVRGHLYRGVKRITGTEKYPGGPRVFSLNGKIYPMARVCWVLHYGFVPTQVRHRDGDYTNFLPDNLYAPGSPEHETHEGRYPYVSVIRDQRTGKHRGYQGSVYHTGRRHRTPVVETAEMARDLRLLLAAQVEWLAQQKETPQ